jgi:hypothetical protein
MRPPHQELTLSARRVVLSRDGGCRAPRPCSLDLSLCCVGGRWGKVPAAKEDSALAHSRVVVLHFYFFPLDSPHNIDNESAQPAMWHACTLNIE